MLALSSPQVVQETALRWKSDGKKIAFVPTMGALHEGHLALVSAASQLAHKVIVSIFVNPLQFGPGEDFQNYPRMLETDAAKIETCGVDILFHPSETELYSPGFATQVRISGLTQHLCGRFRPGHFEGVATVCLKLFNITQCDFAVFGEKDFQQFRVLQQLAIDLNLPLAVVPHRTVREADGLARSSRNAYLNETERALARHIPECGLAAVGALDTQPLATVGDIVSAAAAALEQPGIRIEYLEIASEMNLVPLPRNLPLVSIKSPRLFAAVKVGNTRLIDNFPLYEHAENP